MSTANTIPALPPADWRQKFRRRLLAWYARQARDLPWRRRADAYGVWVSEIMLQQTQVATVIDYYVRFMKRFPNVRALAAAAEQDVLRLWEGLGYYRRARQLHRAAKEIVDVHGGNFPTRFEDVLALPGIGRYTAGAITSIAYDARQPVLEANTIRLYARLLGYAGDTSTKDGQNLLWAFGAAVLPRKNVGQVNQALMELGAEVCTPKSPRCSACPVKGLCATFASGSQDVIPASKKKTQYEAVEQAAVVIRNGHRILVRRCQPDERWAGLWDFPRFDIHSRTTHARHHELKREVARLTGLEISPQRKLTTIKHGVTRYRITLHCHEAELISAVSESPADLQWVTPAELENIPLNTSGRKICQLLIADWQANNLDTPDTAVRIQSDT